MPEFVDNVLLPALLTILTAVIPVLAAMGAQAIRQWAKKQKAVWLQTILLEATTAAENAVMMVNQTFVDRVRKEDGTLDHRQAKEALALALDAAKVQLGVEGMAALQKALGGDVRADMALTTLVEAAVGQAKPHAPSKSAEDFLRMDLSGLR